MGPLNNYDFEGRLQTILNERIEDESSVHRLETFVNDCSKQLSRLLSSNDVHFVIQTTPMLMETLTILLKKCLEKSDQIVVGPHLTAEKRQALLTSTKTFYNQMKEFVKSPKLFHLLPRSSETKFFCHQLLSVSNNIGQTDIVITVICQKLIVKILTGGGNDDQSQLPSSSLSTLSYVKFDDDESNDEFILLLYNSIIKQLLLCWSRSETTKINEARERHYFKICQVFCQMLVRLLPYPGLIEQIQTFRDFIRGLIHLHVSLETTCENEPFQTEFFTLSILLHEIFLELIKLNPKVFVKDLCDETNSMDQYHYASLVVLCRVLVAFDLHLKNHSNDDDQSIHLIDRLISTLFHQIDQCSIQLIQTNSVALSKFLGEEKVENLSAYEMFYSLLLKLFERQPMQILLSSMTHLISMENDSILSFSSQLSCELILQSTFLYASHEQCQDLVVFFLGELLRSDRHSSLVQHLLTLPSIQSLKSRIYQNVLCYDRLTQIYQIFNSNSTSISKERKSLNISSIFPSQLNHLYPFVRLFHSELTSSQQQHAFDTCLYALQQFLSSSILTESNCQDLILILRLLTILPSHQQQQDQWKSLLGQLTLFLNLLDEQSAIDIRLEFLRLFAMHCSLLEENDAGRLLDYILTNSIDSATTHSIAFHLGCLDLIDAFREKSVRSSTINDLIIQLIVRYGNEHQCHPLLKTQLIVNLFFSFCFLLLHLEFSFLF